MSDTDSEPRGAPSYTLWPARAVSDDQLSAFAASVLPEQPPERTLQAWWRDADSDCAVAAIHAATGDMAGLCVGRPSSWRIGGELYPAVAICGWYVAPDHGGRLIGRRLVRHFQRPDRLLYAYSMSEDAVRYLSRLGWVGPYTSLLLALPMPFIARWAYRLKRRDSALTLTEHEIVAPDLSDSLGEDLETIAEQTDRDACAHMRRGRAEWTWRLANCGARTYRLCIARRSGQPLAYIAARRVTPGASRVLGKRETVIITDLVVPENDPALATALIEQAVGYAADMGALLVLAATTIQAQKSAYTALGFLSSSLPLLGGALARRAPQYMWLPVGPGAAISAETAALSFSDSDVDLNL